MNFSDTSLLSLLQTVYAWRKPLIRLTLAGFVLSALASLLLSNYYRAYSKIIPTNAAQVLPKTIFDGGAANTAYGSPEDLDRLQNIAQSSEITDYLISRFGLYKHYNMDSTGALSKYYIEQQFLKLYTVTKDEFGGIEISIEDTDPKLAATMTNATVEKIAEIDRRLATANLRAMVDIYEKSLSASTRMIDSSSERINAINRHYKYSSIVMRRELLSQATPGMSADAQLGLLQKAGRLSNDSLATINENFYAVALLDSRRADANSRYIGEYGLYVRAKACLQSDVKTIQVLEHAAVPLIKSRPKRAIIVLAATFITLFFGIVGILLLVQYRGIDWRKIFSELEALPTPAVAKNK